MKTTVISEEIVTQRSRSGPGSRGWDLCRRVCRHVTWTSQQGRCQCPQDGEGGLSTPTRMGGQSPSRIEGVGLTDSLQDGGSLSQWDGALSPRRMGLTTPAGWGVTPPAGWGSLSQEDGGSLPQQGVHSPAGWGLSLSPAGWGSLSQQDGAHSPSGMGGSLTSPHGDVSALSLHHDGRHRHGDRDGVEVGGVWSQGEDGGLGGQCPPPLHGHVVEAARKPHGAHDGPEQHVHDPATEAWPSGTAPCRPHPVRGNADPSWRQHPVPEARAPFTLEMQSHSREGAGGQIYKGSDPPSPPPSSLPHIGRHLRLGCVGGRGRSEETPGQASEETHTCQYITEPGCSEIVQRTRKTKHV